MLYPLLFEPTYKDYLWGGRNLERHGKTLPKDGIVAESWEISTHPDGESIIANGSLAGLSLTAAVEQFGSELCGSALPEEKIRKFPLLIKLIDAADKLSVQVHPDDNYAFKNESGELGKNEMWYIISAEPGAKLISGLTSGTNRETFAKALQNGEIDGYLNYVEVKAGDYINIPSGMLHAIGKGIILAEVQQNSNTTYRVYDYNRRDAKGNLRELHIQKALDVIDFDCTSGTSLVKGLSVQPSASHKVTYLVANPYFSVEKYEILTDTKMLADGSRFYIYTVLDGQGKIEHAKGAMNVKEGTSVLIPASAGEYTFSGQLTMLRSYVPDVDTHVIAPLLSAGYSYDDILKNVAGISQK